ncbi:MAG: hypothetical protein JKX98_03130 [Alcanivoracaceae bacterium]|nr:hypothetical protein [Alcanivoracaceae bacterium]
MTVKLVLILLSTQTYAIQDIIENNHDIGYQWQNISLKEYFQNRIACETKVQMVKQYMA